MGTQGVLLQQEGMVFTMIFDEINNWAWEPVAGMAFEGDWVDGYLFVNDDERFICDVVAGFDVEKFDDEYDDCEWLVRNTLGAVQQDTSGAMCVYVALPDFGHAMAKPYIGALLNAAIGNDLQFRGAVYNVWVGGVLDAEGVDYFTAVEVSDEWKAQGYDDVRIELSQD